jgi:hypothetical protein
MNFYNDEYVTRAQNLVSPKHSIHLKQNPSKKMIFMVFLALSCFTMPGHVMGVDMTIKKGGEG